MRSSPTDISQALSYTVADACAVTGISRSKLYELIGAGEIDTTTIGRRRLVKAASLRSFIEGEAA